MQGHQVSILRIAAFLLCLALLPLLGAMYGLGNQAGQLALIQRLIDPSFAIGDPFIDSQTSVGQPRFYYAWVMARLTELSSSPLAVHGSIVFWHGVLASGVYWAARKIPDMSVIGAMIAAFLATTSVGIKLGGAGFLSYENFVPASPAAALSVWAVAMMASGRLAAGAILGGIASAFHPLIGIESALLGLGAAGLVVVWSKRTLSARNLGQIAMALVLLVSFFAVLWVLPGERPQGPGLSDAQFFDILVRLRAPHHYLGLTFPADQWLAALVFVGASAVVFAIWITQSGGAGAPVYWVALAFLVVLACGASLLMVDFAESRLWATAQLFRTLMLFKLAANIAIGWVAGRWLVSGGHLPIVGVICLFWASHDAQAYAFALFLAVWAIDQRFKPQSILRWALAVLALGLCALIVDSMGNDRVANRGLVAVIVLALFALRRVATPIFACLVVVTMSGLIWHAVRIAPTGIFGENSLRATYDADDLTSTQADIARHAKRLSEPGDLWVVPPNHVGFRFLAERPLLANLKSVPFDDQAILDWAEITSLLYGLEVGQDGIDGARTAAHYQSGAGLSQAHSIYGAKFAVLYRDTDWPRPSLYENADFKIVALKAIADQ